MSIEIDGPTLVEQAYGFNPVYTLDISAEDCELAGATASSSPCLSVISVMQWATADIPLAPPERHAFGAVAPAADRPPLPQRMRAELMTTHFEITVDRIPYPGWRLNLTVPIGAAVSAFKTKHPDINPERIGWTWA